MFNMSFHQSYYLTNSRHWDLGLNTVGNQVGNWSRHRNPFNDFERHRGNGLDILPRYVLLYTVTQQHY